jgi:hypothetical protein
MTWVRTRGQSPGPPGRWPADPTPRPGESAGVRQRAVSSARPAGIDAWAAVVSGQLPAVVVLAAGAGMAATAVAAAALVVLAVVVPAVAAVTAPALVGATAPAADDPCAAPAVIAPAGRVEVTRSGLKRGQPVGRCCAGGGAFVGGGTRSGVHLRRLSGDDRCECIDDRARSWEEPQRPLRHRRDFSGTS